MRHLVPLPLSKPMLLVSELTLPLVEYTLALLEVLDALSGRVRILLEILTVSLQNSDLLAERGRELVEPALCVNKTVVHLAMISE